MKFYPYHILKSSYRSSYVWSEEISVFHAQKSVHTFLYWSTEFCLCHIWNSGHTYYIWNMYLYLCHNIKTTEIFIYIKCETFHVSHIKANNGFYMRCEVLVYIKYKIFSKPHRQNECRFIYHTHAHICKTLFAKMMELKDICSSSPIRTPKLQLAAEQPSTGECWIPPYKDTPGLGGKEKPQQGGGRRGKNHI